MKFAMDLLKRLGLIGEASQLPDAFDLRLRRIESREARVIQRRALFRPSLRLREA